MSPEGPLPGGESSPMLQHPLSMGPDIVWGPFGSVQGARADSLEDDRLEDGCRMGIIEVCPANRPGELQSARKISEGCSRTG